MKSEQILSIIAMAKMYNKTPSEILFVTEDYPAYCLNEACAVIQNKIDNGNKPIFRQAEKSKVKSHYSSFSSLYEDIKKG